MVGLTSTPTWPTVLDTFLAEYPNAETQRRHRRELTQLFRTNGWDHPHQMTAPGVVAFCTQPTAHGPRANNSVRARVAILRTFITWCRENDIPAPTVTKQLRRLQDAHPQLLGKVQDANPANRLGAADLHKLYDACRDGTWTGSRDQLTIRLLALGLRLSEVAHLTWGALQPDGAIRTLGKGNKTREVWPAATLAAQLTRWHAFYLRNVGPATPSAPLLCHWNNHLTTAQAGIGISTIANLLTKRASAAGLEHVAPHDLRRSLARIMWDTTDDAGRHTYQLAEIAHALGHSIHSLTVTQGAYIGPLDNAARTAAGQLVD